MQKTLSELIKVIEIERVENLSVTDFYQDYFGKGRPVIITGALKGWKPFVEWTPEYLKSVVGSVDVNVWVSPTGRFYPNIGSEDLHMFGVERMKFNNYLDLVFTENEMDKHYYLPMQPLQQKNGYINQKMRPSVNGLSLLNNDIQTPIYLKDINRLEPVNIWVGTAGNATGLHYDPYYNLFAQIIGRKKFTIFPPEVKKMYPFSLTRGAKASFSRVEIDKLNLEKFPKFKDVVAYETILNPGELLYLPLLWWHNVVSLDSSVSLNFWWSPPPLRMLANYPLGTKYLPMIFFMAFNILKHKLKRQIGGKQRK